MDLVDVFALWRGILPKEDAEDDDGEDGQKLALPVREGVDLEFVVREKFFQAGGRLAVARSALDWTPASHRRHRWRMKRFIGRASPCMGRRHRRRFARERE